MTTLFLYDDARARSFEPFASTRPVSELVAGIALIRDRWKAALQPSAGTRYLAGDAHADFDEAGLDARPPAADDTIPAGSIIANARFAPAFPADARNIAQRVATCTMWRAENQLVAVRVKEPVP